MTMPLQIMMVLSICAGWVAIPWLKEGYSRVVYFHEPEQAQPHYLIMLVSSIVALSGIGLAYLMYYKRSISADALAEKFKPLYTTLYNKWYFDEIYDRIIIKPVLALTSGLWIFDNGVIDWVVNFFGKFTVWLSDVKQWFDVHIVDGAVNGLGYTVWSFGALIRQVQTGRVQLYGFFIVFGIVLMLLIKVV